MNRILLVEDSESSLKVVESALSDSGVELTVARTVAEAKSATSNGADFQMILLDISLPDGEGLELMREWKEDPRFRRTPVLLLTGKEDVEVKVSAFALGADDYIVKPVVPRELKARVEARLRKQPAGPLEVLRRGRLALNFPLMKVLVKDDEGAETPIELTSKEFRLLATLAQHEGQVFSRSELVKAIWGNDMHVVNRTVDSHICGARRKLGPAGDYIESVTGEGYRFSVKD
jgi:DNA-binding response OmpR family regulator